jgi:hypothetical protein
MGLTTALSDVATGLNLLASFGSRIDVVGIYASPNQPGPSAATGNPSSSFINSLLGQSNNAIGSGQMFVNARPLKATIRETSKVMEHPVESGAVLADHHIINPVEIDLPLMVASQFYVQTYQGIKNAFVNATNLTVKTPVNVFNNMIIADMPHEEDPQFFDSILIALHLKQVLFFTAGQTAAQFSQANYAPVAPANQNTLQTGLQQAVALGTRALTTASSVLSYASLAKRF